MLSINIIASQIESIINRLIFHLTNRYLSLMYIFLSYENYLHNGKSCVKMYGMKRIKHKYFANNKTTDS